MSRLAALTMSSVAGVPGFSSHRWRCAHTIGSCSSPRLSYGNSESTERADEEEEVPDDKDESELCDDNDADDLFDRDRCRRDGFCLLFS